MTYNFDPDNWYENELAYLQARLKTEKITEKEFSESVKKIDKQHEEMWNRLDGTYQIYY